MTWQQEICLPLSFKLTPVKSFMGVKELLIRAFRTVTMAQKTRSLQRFIAQGASAQVCSRYLRVQEECHYVLLPAS